MPLKAGRRGLNKRYLDPMGNLINGGGSDITVEPLSVTENGIYTAPSGKAYSPVTVNVPASAAYIADWDFTGGTLIDSVSGLEATLNNATQSEDGISISDGSAYISFPAGLNACIRTYEIEIGAMSFVGTGHHRLFMMDMGEGLIYRSSGKWSFYNGGSWATDSEITDFDYFANSTVKIIIDVNKNWHIYKDDVLVYEPDITYAPSNIDVLWIGSSSNSCNSAVIKKFRVK